MNNFFYMIRMKRLTIWLYGVQIHLSLAKIHNWSSAWSDVTKRKSDSMSAAVQTWVESGIDALSFMRSFKGNYYVISFDSDIPPKQFFPNAPSCKSYKSFIKEEINERLKNGSFKL